MRKIGPNPHKNRQLKPTLHSHPPSKPPALLYKLTLLLISAIQRVSPQIQRNRTIPKILMYKGDSKEIYFQNYFEFDTSSNFSYKVFPDNYSKIMKFTVYQTINKVSSELHHMLDKLDNCDKASTLGKEQFLAYCKQHMVGTLIYPKMPKIYQKIVVPGVEKYLKCRQAISFYYQSLIHLGVFQKIHMVYCHRDPKVPTVDGQDEVMIRFMLLNRKFDHIGRLDWRKSHFDFTQRGVDMGQVDWIYIAQNITESAGLPLSDNQCGMICFYPKKDPLSIKPECKLLIVRKTENNKEIFESGKKYKAEFDLPILQAKNLQILKITSMNNENRPNELDFVYYTQYPIQGQGKITLQSIMLNGTKGVVQFYKRRDYAVSLSVSGFKEKVKVISWKQKEINLIDDKKLIFLFYQPPKGNSAKIISSVYYDLLCTNVRLDDTYKFNGFDMGTNYIFTSFKSKKNPKNFIYTIIDRKGSALQGIKCMSLKDAEFINFNRDDKIRYYKNDNLTTLELSRGSLVMSTIKTTDEPYLVTVTQTSKRFQNNSLHFNVSVIQDPYGRFEIDLKFETINVLHGGWTELQVGPGTFQGNDALVSLRGIEKSDYRIIEAEANICKINPRTKGSLMYTGTIMYIEFIKSKVLLASVRNAYGTYFCEQKPDDELIIRCNCTEISVSTLPKDQYVIYSKNINDNFILLVTAKSISKSQSLLQIKDTNGKVVLRKSDKAGGKVDKDEIQNSVELVNQKGDCLAYPSADKTRLIYIRNIKDGTDLIWSVVLSRRSDKNQEVYFTTTEDQQLEIIGFNDSNVEYNIFKLKSISESTNSFMFNGRSNATGPFVAYVKISKSCPRNLSSCLTLEQTWNLNEFHLADFNRFDFCPMNKDLILFNYPKETPNHRVSYDDVRDYNDGAIFAIPLKKIKPYASLKQIRLGYPFLELGVVQLVDIKCTGLLNSFEILVNVTYKNTTEKKYMYKKQIISYQSHANEDPRDRINIIINDINKDANALAVWGDVGRSLVKTIAYFKQLSETAKPSSITFLNFNNTIYNIPSQRRIQFLSSYARKGFPMTMMLSTKSSIKNYSKASRQITVKINEPQDTPLIKINTSKAVSLNNLTKDDFEGDELVIGLEDRGILNITNHYFRSNIIKRASKETKEYETVVYKNSPVRLNDKATLIGNMSLQDKQVLAFTQKGDWVMVILISGKVMIARMDKNNLLDLKNYLEININAKYIYLISDHGGDVMYGFMLIDLEEGDKIRVVAFNANTESFTYSDPVSDVLVNLYSTIEEPTQYSYYKISVYLCSERNKFMVVMMDNERTKETNIIFDPNSSEKPSNAPKYYLNKATFTKIDLKFDFPIRDYSSLCLPDSTNTNQIFTQVIIHPIAESLTIYKIDMGTQKIFIRKSIDLLPKIPEVYPLNIGFLRGKDHINREVADGHYENLCYITYSGIWDYVFKFDFNTVASNSTVVNGVTVHNRIPKVKSFVSVNLNTFHPYVILIGFNLADKLERMSDRKYHLLVFNMSQNSIIGSFVMSLQSKQNRNLLSVCVMLRVSNKTNGKGEEIKLFILQRLPTIKHGLANSRSIVKVYTLQNMALRIKKSYLRNLTIKAEEGRRRRALASSSTRGTSTSATKALSSGSSTGVHNAKGDYFEPELYRIVSYGFDNATSHNISMKLLINAGPPSRTDQERFMIHLFYCAIAFCTSMLLCALCLCIMAYRQKMIKDELKQAKGGVELKIVMNEVTGIETEQYVARPRL